MGTIKKWQTKRRLVTERWKLLRKKIFEVWDSILRLSDYKSDWANLATDGPANFSTSFKRHWYNQHSHPIIFTPRSVPDSTVARQRDKFFCNQITKEYLSKEWLPENRELHLYLYQSPSDEKKVELQFSSRLHNSERYRWAILFDKRLHCIDEKQTSFLKCMVTTERVVRILAYKPVCFGMRWRINIFLMHVWPKRKKNIGATVFTFNAARQQEFPVLGSLGLSGSYGAESLLKPEKEIGILTIQDKPFLAVLLLADSRHWIILRV